MLVPSVELNRPIRHLGFAVADLEQAVRDWVAVCGAGPFCHLGSGPLRLRDVAHRGRPAEWSHSTATGQCGELMIELFESHSAAPATLAAEMGVDEIGLHHVGWFAEDVWQESKRLESIGAPLVLAGGVNEMDFVFHDARSLSGVRVEVYEPLPRVVRHYELVRAAAQEWDGSDPLLALADFRRRYASGTAPVT